MEQVEQVEWMEWLCELRNYTTAVQLRLGVEQLEAKMHAESVDQMIAERLKALGE